MKLLKSTRLEIPKLFFVSDKAELAELPLGVPFILGEPGLENYLIRILEYEILYQAALKSGYKFNFKKILKEQGYDDLIDFGYGNTVYMDYTTDGYIDEDFDIRELEILSKDSTNVLKEFIKDSSVYVDIQKIKNLNIFPVWLEKIEDAISTNLHNFATFNDQMYNKKLKGMYGSLEMSAPARNLIVIDISGSIPRGVTATTLTLSKNLAESFFADILVTGSYSTLYTYEELEGVSVNDMYQNGTGNEQKQFKALLSGERRVYNTVIGFGDNHSPCEGWGGSGGISRKQGKKLCTWEVNKMISFHTTSNFHLAGYLDWFNCEDVENVSDWVQYLDN